MLIVDASRPSSSSTLLSPSACAQLLRNKILYWYCADNLSLDANNLVSGATDLTGNNLNGIQTTASDRLTFFAADPNYGGRSSFGSTTNIGRLSLESPSIQTTRMIFISWYYKDGLDAVADFANILVSGTGTQSFPRVTIRPGASEIESFITSRTFNDSSDPFPIVNGSTNRSLPLASSVIRVQNSAGRTDRFHFGPSIQVDQSPVGAFRHCVACNAILTTEEINLVEGVIAWSDGFQQRLIAGHPYRNNPPV